MSRRRGPSADLSRKPASRNEKQLFALYCEGKLTEPEYFQAVIKAPEVRQVSSVSLKIKKKGELPLQLVEAALRDLQSGFGADEYWCVFDSELPAQHPHFDAALRLAEAHGIRVAWSNPCFEVWLILHHEDHRAPFDSSASAKRRRRLIDQIDKDGVDGSRYVPLIANAVARARGLRASHSRNGNAGVKANPSTNVDELMTAIGVQG